VCQARRQEEAISTGISCNTNEPKISIVVDNVVPAANREELLLESTETVKSAIAAVPGPEMAAIEALANVDLLAIPAETFAAGICAKTRLMGIRPASRLRADSIVSAGLMDLRESGRNPWGDIVDETRDLADFSGSESVAIDLLGYLNFLARINPWNRDVPPILTESRSLAGQHQERGGKHCGQAALAAAGPEQGAGQQVRPAGYHQVRQTLQGSTRSAPGGRHRSVVADLDRQHRAPAARSYCGNRSITYISEHTRLRRLIQPQT
jgi:hypothetical protein